MNPHSKLESHLNWLLNHSLEAGMLVLLVLAVQWLFRRRLTNRWRFALWWIVLARLLLPFSPPSAVSLFNLFQPAVRITGLHPASSRLPYISYAPAFPQVENALPHDPFPTPTPVTVPAASSPQPDTTAKDTSIQIPVRNFNDLLIPCLSTLWLAGVFALSGVVAAQLLRFNRKLARASGPSNPDLQTLLDDCRRDFGVSRPIALLETDAVQSPALFGLVRLRLLLPRGLGAQFAGRELRYIFLHEIAHVKRGDLWLNWLVTTLQILHWFNPLLWLGFARLRADRELACDELALLRAGDHTGAAYGETVVKLLENLGRPAAIPGLVGILQDKKQMRRRISMIANFRRPGRWSALAAILILALAAAALTDAESNSPADSTASPARMKSDNDPQNQTNNATQPQDRPDLVGTISVQGGGALPAAANVFVVTAAPKTGTSTFCPSCYADCTKRAQTDAQGHFKIESLDPQLTFQILAVARGCQPKYVGHVDPAKGPVRIDLEPVESVDAALDRSLRGRVVNAKGEPVAGAVVEMDFLLRGDGTGGSNVPGVDPLAVTDEQGEFLLTAKDPFATMNLKISARTYADKLFNEVPSGKQNELVITEGASLTGRVLGGSEPLVGVSVGVSGVDRVVPNYLGHFEVATGARGAFTLVNLPPDADFWLYAKMDSMKGAGAVPLRKIHTGKDGETADAGDLVAGPTYRLAGRVVLADGQPVPATTRLLVGREDAWDSMQIVLGHDGSFDTTCPSGETIDLSVRVKGYHVSSRNSSLDPINPFRLIGRMDRNITNLVFLLEKGPDLRPDRSQSNPDYMEARNRPIQGAELIPDHSREWSVSGHVLDADTHQPVPDFRVSPGQTDSFGRAGWNTLRPFTGTNGAFLAYINKRTAEPMLLVDADGYLPQVVSLKAGDATNVNFTLKRGAGPAGTVVQPDGTPAAGASVVLLSDDSNQASLAGKGELSAYSRPSAICLADAIGNFAFKPEWGITAVAAASSNGFAVLDVESLATNPVIQLDAFGEISGRLQRTSGLGTNEDLDLEFAGAARHLSGFNLNLQARTDAQGRFEFKGVPPGHFQISYREPMGNLNSWHNMALKEVDVLPGQSLAVNIETTDRPVPQSTSFFQQPPPPKLIPGAQVKGVVLLPNGQPAADADVALQVEGKLLLIGKGAFSGGRREEGLVVGTGAEGTFTLPLYEKAQSVIALNEEGYAQVSLEELKASHEIRLQKWGRIEGTLRVGHHLGTNEQVILSAAPAWSKKTVNLSGQNNNPLEMISTNSTRSLLPHPIYDSSAFKSRTDDQGRFVITFVPPGEQVIARLVPAGVGSWNHRPVATLEVKPGETVVTNVGGGGRIVTGKLQFDSDVSPDLKSCFVTIATSMAAYRDKLRQLKTDAERQAFNDSDEVVAAKRNIRSFPATVQPDGSTRAEEVPPGTYELNFRKHFRPEAPTASRTTVTCTQEVIVPPAANENDDSVVDWGIIELNKGTLPEPDSPLK